MTSAPATSLKVGEPRLLHGDVTTLIWIGPRTPQEIENRLGYGRGRLSNGYWVALLKDPLSPRDFEFGGTTLRSDGRLGLPAGSSNADRVRQRVHQQILDDRGEAGYRDLQRWAIASVRLFGPQRIAKVVPAQWHDPTLAPNVQYPPGGGGLQWRILPPGKKFLIAMHVAASGVATTPTFAADLSPGAPYENRHKVMRYLEAA